MILFWIDGEREKFWCVFQRYAGLDFDLRVDDLMRAILIRTRKASLTRPNRIGEEFGDVGAEENYICAGCVSGGIAAAFAFGEVVFRSHFFSWFFHNSSARLALPGVRV